VTTDQVASEVALLQGDDMLKPIVATCKLVNDNFSVSNLFLPKDPAQRMAMKVESAARTLARNIKVESQKASDVIDVSYARSGAPETPACVLQTLSKLYLEKHLQLQRPAGASDFFATETTKYQAALADAEGRLANFSREEGVAAPDVMRTDLALQLAGLKASLYQAQQGVAADELRIEDEKRQLGATPPRTTTSEVTNSSNLLIQNLKASLLASEVKRTQLVLTYEPTYPLVQEVDQEIVETKDAIAAAEGSIYVNKTTDRDPTFEYLRQDEAKTEADLASEKATESALNTSIRKMQSEMVDLDGKAVKQTALIREAKADEGNYLLYLGKREQERTSDALDQKGIANVAIAVPADVPALPAHSPLLVMLIGFIAAILASVAAAYVAEHLDSSFRTPMEVTEILHIPVLAAVPRKVA